MKKLETKQIIELGDAIDKLKIALDEIVDKYNKLENMLKKNYMEICIEETFKRR